MSLREEIYNLLGKYHEAQHLNPEKNAECEEQAIRFFIYQCEAIERSPLTLEEVDSIITNKNPKDDDAFELETLGLYNAAIYTNKLAEQNIDVTENIVKDLHTIIYKFATEDFKGQYRTDYVTIPHARNLPPVHHISYHMNKLFEEYEETKEMDVIERIALFHLKFENVHPFADGNGQVGRLIINYQLIRAGYPYICIHNNKKKEYIKAFESFYLENDIKPMVDIISNAIIDELKARIENLNK